MVASSSGIWLHGGDEAHRVSRDIRSAIFSFEWLNSVVDSISGFIGDVFIGAFALLFITFFFSERWVFIFSKSFYAYA